MPLKDNLLTVEEMAQIKKVLVIQLGPIGDGLLTTAYFEYLKKYLPQIELHYLIKEPFHKIVIRHPFIDKLITIPKRKGPGYVWERLKTMIRVRREKYDLVIDQQNMPASQQITLVSGAPFRVGYADARFHQVYNLKAVQREYRYNALRRFDILAPLGIEEQTPKLYYPIPEEDQEYIDEWLRSTGLSSGKVIVISPGSPVKKKKWLLKNYAALADMIQNQLKLDTIIIWAPNELNDAKEMQSLMQTRSILAPRTTLEQAAALLKRCCLLICNDGGLNHIAVTTETTTLAIFGNTHPIDWSPASIYSHHHHLYISDKDFSSDSSFGITPEDAFNEVKKILQENKQDEKN